MLSGKHLIDGKWVSGQTTFTSTPAEGPSHAVAIGTSAEVEQASLAAEAAFFNFANTSREQRAAFLDRIAHELESRADAIIETGSRETGLPVARLTSELGRTTGQLRLFSRHIVAGDYLDLRHDAALPDRQPQPRPDLRLVQRPVGPVAVFGASNFPLAFSVAGGDTASALAAGCPVIVKGHPAHPGTGEIAAAAIDAARNYCDLPPGIFAFIQGADHSLSRALVTHPYVKAVAFTGSLVGGRTLFDLCAQRPEPIPCFAELGSINPVFFLPQALGARGASIAQGWAASLAMGAGQFCTNPGVAVLFEGADSDAFIEFTAAALSDVPFQTMLTDSIADAYRAGIRRLQDTPGVRAVLVKSGVQRTASPCLYVTSAKRWLSDAALGEEVFGPAGLLVTVADFDEMLAVAHSLQGQLTCTVQMDAADREQAQQLLPILERKAGRLLANGFPTGVEVCDAMVHGGPYPASTNFGATSVGTMAIRRFLRPVCYQSFPEELLPADLQMIS